MDHFLPAAVDLFLRKHPRVMVGLLVLVALAALWILIGSGNTITAYEGF